MADQAPVSGSEAPRDGRRDLHRNLAEAAHDILVLAELQVGLLRADAADAARRMVVPAALSLAGVLLALACFPILLASLALALSAWMPMTIAFLTAGAAGLLAAALTLWLAWRLVRKNLASFHRSREEFAENLRWIKSVLKRGGG